MAARSTSSAPARTAADDATALLAADHREVHALFEDYRKLARAGAAGDERRPLAEEICMLLTVHAAIEEEIFYPALRAAGIAADLLDEAEVEHASAKELIAQIRDMEAEAPLYDAKVVVLGEYIAHHVVEEEDKLFAKCRAIDMDLHALGRRVAARKDELMSEMSEGMEVLG
jgi:hemerythrin superfamily protein